MKMLTAKQTALMKKHKVHHSAKHMKQMKIELTKKAKNIDYV